MAVGLKWKRVTGIGYDLVGTRYGVRWAFGQNEDGDTVDYKREYAVVDLERDDNLEWFAYADEAKRAAERRARNDAR